MRPLRSGLRTVPRQVWDVSREDTPVIETLRLNRGVRRRIDKQTHERHERSWERSDVEKRRVLVQFRRR